MTKQKNQHKDLALISVILGSTSFIYSIFTGIPAIILGVMALKRKAGNPAQAKLGIAFGIVGSLLIIPLVALLLYLLRAPLQERQRLPSDDRQQIEQILEGIKSYRKKHGAYPACLENNSNATTMCAEWDKMLQEGNLTPPYPTVFSGNSSIPEQIPGTLVYAERTECLINTPIVPGSFGDRNYGERNLRRHAALIYYFDGGKVCFGDDY